jgi:threonine synthase
VTCHYTGRMRCPRCDQTQPETAAYGGCPHCAEDGKPVNLAPLYEIPAGARALTLRADQPGLFRHRSMLPLRDVDRAVSLGEGDTPLLRLVHTETAASVGDLWLKDESRNPTWSYKDRLAAVAVTKARAMGADTVVVATTGNHGAAVAAYAAAAGLRCVVLTLTSVPSTMLTLMQAYGAEVVAFESPPDRWSVMAAAVQERGWVPMSGFQNPPVGSNPFGVDGYKTIAYEIVAQLGRVPDVVVAPTAYADGLAGLHRGFQDLCDLRTIPRLPRLVAAEVFGPYDATLRSGRDTTETMPTQPSVAFSIATPWATYQGVDALRRTNGRAVAISGDERIIDAQLDLARTEGLYLEASSVLPLLAVQALADDDWITTEDVVVTLGTSTGMKDIDATAARLAQPPVAEPSLAGLDAALRHPAASGAH